MKFLAAAISRFRSVFSIALLLVLMGLFARSTMTIQSFPDIVVPVVTVSVFLDGVSPEDGARLLVRPLEAEIRNVEGIKEISSTSRESTSYLVIEFEPEIDTGQALLDTRAAVDRAKAELPQSAEEPEVNEISANTFPTIVVAVSGDGVPERALYASAQALQHKIELMPGVLSADLSGQREEVLEVVIRPEQLAYYNVTSSELSAAVLRNNLLVPAGQLDDGSGKFAVKVPGLIESAEDVYGLPLKATGSGVVTLSDIADIRRTFKDASTVTTVTGQKSITVTVIKRTGANLIEVAEGVRELVDVYRDEAPGGVDVSFLLDQAPYTRELVGEMEGNIITAMGLVMIIVVAALGLRSGLLVGFGIPFSLLFGLIINSQLGYSFNFMVMFGMLLALGMLIDGAIVVTEYADRKMTEGLSSVEAYQIAVKRMFWPVSASVATTLAAFLPLMLWPGVVGQFMRYLPVTVFAVLSGSLLYALLFVPVLGAILCKGKAPNTDVQGLKSLENCKPMDMPGLAGSYARGLLVLLRYPERTFLVTIAVLVGIFFLFNSFSKGVEFFTDSEDPYATMSIRAQGNLSSAEMADIVQQVEKRVIEFPEVYATYTRAGTAGDGTFSTPAKDTIGEIFIELHPPKFLDRKVRELFAEINASTEDIPGIYVNTAVIESGPPTGRPVQMQLASDDIHTLLATTRSVRRHLDTVSGLRDVTDSSPLPGIEWQLTLDRGLAAQMGADLVEVGQAVQLVTGGVLVGEYRPYDADDEVDIRVRFPEESRGITQLDTLLINTSSGSVPISSFVSRQARQKVDTVKRRDGRQVMTVSADLDPGILADDKVKEISKWLETAGLDQSVDIVFRGANEEQEKSLAFLSTAFSLALFLMFVLLVTQFNSIYQALLILSAVIMSTAGVLVGLVITQATFSVILTGVGIVALAGIVVNNNIVLIDTYNYVRTREPELSLAEASAKAAAQRLRPVFLTTVTTILGLLPIALNISVDLIGRSVVHGGSVSSNWQPLASAIVNGLAFSTLLTLLVTPVMLLLPSRPVFWVTYLTKKQSKSRQPV